MKNIRITDNVLEFNKLNNAGRVIIDTAVEPIEKDDLTKELSNVVFVTKESTIECTPYLYGGEWYEIPKNN